MTRHELIPENPERTKNINLMLRIDPEMKKELDQVAHKYKVSANRLAIAALRFYLDEIKAERL